MAKVTQGVFHGGLPLERLQPRGTRGDSRIQRSIPGTNRIEVADADYAAAIGLYLPFGLSVAIFIGALAHSFFGSDEEAESGPASCWRPDWWRARR